MTKTTLIIDGTRGLGKIASALLTQEGHDITMLARNKPNF